MAYKWAEDIDVKDGQKGIQLKEKVGFVIAHSFSSIPGWSNMCHVHVSNLHLILFSKALIGIAFWQYFIILKVEKMIDS